MSELTQVGTPCEHCGKKIGRAMLKAYPYARYCKGTCLASAAITDLQARIATGRPLFDDMRCANCGGELRVYTRDINNKATLNVCVSGCSRVAEPFATILANHGVR